MKRIITSLIVSLALAVGVGTIAPQYTTYAADTTADYSCGAYGGGNYSSGACTTSASSTTAPNTGFAALTQPGVAIPLGLSLLALIVGIALLVRRRRNA